MPDADVIPLGGRGEPGRGSNRRSTPSSASRSLAGGRARPSRNGRATAAANGASVGNGAGAAAGPAGAAGPTARPGLPRPNAADPTLARTPPRTGPVRPAGAEQRVGESPLVGLARLLGGAAEQVLGPDAERRAADMLSFLRRRLTGDYEVDIFGFDRELNDEVLMAALRPLYRHWFRVEVRGIENIPATGGALVVANHSGTIPLDSLMTQLALLDEHPARRHLRTLGADLVFRMPVVGEFARKSGSTLACTEDAERLLSSGELTGVWPEGFKGIGKPFRERYKLQRFGRGGFVSAALRTGTPIVPCSIVGAEEIYPLLGDMPTLARLLGVPYVPITPTFPWFGLLGLVPLPSKWIIEFGDPIRTDTFPAGAADDPMLVFNLTDQVRETIQHTLYALLVGRRRTFF